MERCIRFINLDLYHPNEIDVHVSSEPVYAIDFFFFHDFMVHLYTCNLVFCISTVPMLQGWVPVHHGVPYGHIFRQ